MHLQFKFPASGIQLSDTGVVSQDVQCLRAGTFYHDAYGAFSVTQETLVSIIKNFEANVRGVALAVDYSHENWAEAAGWFKSLSLRNNGTELWAEIEWTKRAMECLAGKEYRYFSSEFSFDYVDNETGVHHGPTLYGGGLTNRPAIKKMAPIVELSETKGEYMNELEQLKATVAEQKATIEAQGTEISQLKEAVKTLSEEKEGLVKAAEETKKLAEKTSAFEILLSEGKACEAQRKAFLDGDMAEFAKLQKPLNLGAQGHGHEGGGQKVDPESKTPAQDELIKLAEKALSEKRATSMVKAISLVRSENPELVTKALAETGGL